MAYFEWLTDLARCLGSVGKLLREQLLATSSASWLCQFGRPVDARPPGLICHVQPLFYWSAFRRLAASIGIITSPRWGGLTSSRSAVPQVREAAP